MNNQMLFKRRYSHIVVDRLNSENLDGVMQQVQRSLSGLK